MPTTQLKQRHQATLVFPAVCIASASTAFHEAWIVVSSCRALRACHCAEREAESSEEAHCVSEAAEGTVEMRQQRSGPLGAVLQMSKRKGLGVGVILGYCQRGKAFERHVARQRSLNMLSTGPTMRPGVVELVFQKAGCSCDVAKLKCLPLAQQTV